MSRVPLFDEELFTAIRNISPYFDEVDWMQDHIRISHEERDSFLNNEIENPLFTYRPQNIQVNYEEKLDVLRACMRQPEVPSVVVDLYQRKMEKQLLRNTIIGSSLGKDDRTFFKASCDLYGKPKKKYFAYIAKRLLKLCANKKETHPGSARRLSKIASKINTENVDIDVSMLPDPVTTGTPIKSTVEVVEIFTAVINRCGIEDWVVQVDEAGTRSRFAVNVQQKVIHIPSDQQLFSRPQKLTDIGVQALAEHEVGVHVRRSYEAQKGPLRLLEIGLDSYLAGEEGLASYVQQQIEGSDEFYGLDRYLAACLAVGMDGEERDFRAVFSLMLDYYILKFSGAKAGHTDPYRAAWDVCVRIFRGTTGQSAGCIFTKDIVYMEGNIGIWNLLSERPRVFESLFVGKYNPLLSRHVHTLQTLEILGEW